MKRKTPKRKQDWEKLQPIQLATLAGIVAPNEEPQRAMKRALEFYTEALRTVGDLQGVSFEQLMYQFASSDRRWADKDEAFKAAIKDMVNNTLELDPTHDNDSDDPARRFLRQRKCTTKGHRQILRNLAGYWEWSEQQRPSRWTVEAIIGKRVINGKTTYHIPPLILSGMVAWMKRRASESKKKGAATKAATNGCQINRISDSSA